MKEKAEIAAIQTRLESLTGGSGVGPHNSVYSLKLAGEEDPFGSGQVNGSGGGGGSNDSEIESLTAKLGSKAAKITVYSGQINKIQTSTGKAIHSMSKASHNYQKTVKQNQVQTQKNQAQLNNTYQTIDTINMVAQGTMLVGQMVEGFGQGMRAMGEKMVESQNPATASAGAALIAASVPIEETGNVTKTIGAYASTAVSVTKGVCQMADGDIGGAMQSIMAATTTVAAAIEGTKTMQSGFEGIKNDAQSAMQTGLEKQAAKAIYNQNKTAMKEAGFSKKQIKQMANEQTAGKMKGTDMNEIRDQLKLNKNGAKGSHIGMAANMINAGNEEMQNTLNSVKNNSGGDKNLANTIKSSQSSAEKALTSLKAIGMSFMAAGTIAGIAIGLTQSSSTPSVGKKERHREGKPINIDVNHSYMKELAHRKRMARAEAAEHRRG